MTNGKHNATSLDEVLASYASASSDFDPKVLQEFVKRFPGHADALRRYAHIQLTSAPATADEIEKETLSDEELLPAQSKLLERLQSVRAQDANSSDATTVARKLASISGATAINAAADRIFNSHAHGEDLLILSVLDSVCDIINVPNWFYEHLGGYLEVTPAALMQGLAAKRQAQSAQRYSSQSKPSDSPPISWDELVKKCITDDAVVEQILILERQK